MEREGAERSLIVELMEQPAVQDAECAAIHFDDLATGNEAKRSAVTSCTQVAGSSTRLGSDPPCFHLHGVQTLAVGEDAEYELQVRQHLSIARPSTPSHQIPLRPAAGAASGRPSRRVQDRPARVDLAPGGQDPTSRRGGKGSGGRCCARAVCSRQHRDQGQRALWRVEGLARLSVCD